MKPTHLLPRVAFLAWFLAALVVAATGVLSRVPPPVVPLTIFGSVALVLVAHRRSAAVRAAVQAVDLRVVVAFHLVRIPFAIFFLREAAAGVLSPAFARVAAPGDLLAGGLAVVALLVAGDLGTPGRRAAVLAWNTVGLLDMLAVVGTAQRLILVDHDPRMSSAFATFPYGALPAFVVPVILLTHLLVFARLRASAAATTPAGA